MRIRLALAAALAALLAVVAVTRPSGADRAAPACTPAALQAQLAAERLGREEGADEREAAGACGTGALEAQELSEPNEVMLARQLTGADPGVDPATYFAAATKAAQALPVADARWSLVGPSNIGGRVLDIVVDPTQADTIYIAAATGGVWKSVDKGRNFTPAWPDDLTQTVGALAVDSQGVLYAGTGEAGPGGGSSTYGGSGLYRSADGGENWESLGLEETNRIGRVVIDPKDDDRIWVAGTGPLYKKGGGRGLYLSTNGGESFTRVLAGENDTAGAVDVAVDPTNSDVVYAAMWDNYRERDRRLYEGLGSGLFKTTDGGATWKRVGTPYLGPRPDVGRIGVAVAKTATGTVVYANASGASGVYSGFFSSTDGGATWTTGQPPANPQNSFYVYGWWFGRIYVDPADPQHVYQAALVLQESKDGGRTWANAPGGCSNICDNGHADQHAMAYDPKAPGRVYLGNDGGVFRSDDNGARWSRFRSLPISQVNGFDVSQQDPTRVIVGLQDNGSNRNWKGGEPGGQEFTSVYGGDGQRVSIAPTRQNVLYACYQYGACAVSSNGGAGTSTMGLATPVTGSAPGTRWNWFAPIEFDPRDDRTIYSASEMVSVSHDDGENFDVISPDLTGGFGRETNPLFRNYGTVTTLAPAADGKTLYAGTDDGRLWYTHDVSSIASWTRATDPDLPDAWVTRVEADPANADVAYATFSGFRQANDAAYVFRTTDGGRNWEPFHADLPRAPVNDVLVVGNAVVVATDVGVFSRGAGDAGWSRVGANLPAAPAYELRYAAKTDELFVGTFGRSVWKTDASVLR